MNASARLGPLFPPGTGTRGSPNSPQATAESSSKPAPEQRNKNGEEAKCRVFVAAENRLLREALGRMLAKRGGFEVLGLNEGAHEEIESFADRVSSLRVQTLVLSSHGSPERDLRVIREFRLATRSVRILVLGLSGNELEFLGYVRAGIDGCLLRDATAQDVLEAVRAVNAGDTVCPGALCSVLFRYFERDAGPFPSASMNREMGLTRREQQLIPLIARGLTNKEIANHFCLSEQTVKNHVYRMKQKIGAYDRLGIVQLCQQQGFLV